MTFLNIASLSPPVRTPLSVLSRLLSSPSLSFQMSHSSCKITTFVIVIYFLISAPFLYLLSPFSSSFLFLLQSFFLFSSPSTFVLPPLCYSPFLLFLHFGCLFLYYFPHCFNFFLFLPYLSPFLLSSLSTLSSILPSFLSQQYLTSYSPPSFSTPPFSLISSCPAPPLPLLLTPCLLFLPLSSLPSVQPPNICLISARISTTHLLLIFSLSLSHAPQYGLSKSHPLSITWYLVVPIEYSVTKKRR